MNRITHTLYASILCLLSVAMASHAHMPLHTLKAVAQRFPKTLAATATGITSVAAAGAYYQLPENISLSRAHVTRFYPQATPAEVDTIAHACYRRQLIEKPAGLALAAAGTIRLAQIVGSHATPRAALCCSALSGMVTAYFFPTWYDTAVEMHAIRAARRA